MKKPESKTGSKRSEPETTKPVVAKPAVSEPSTAKPAKTAVKKRKSASKTRVKQKKSTAGKMTGRSVTPAGAPDLNASDYPMHPPRIWPD